MSRYFDAGIQVPIVIFADPTGREIPGTRLDHEKAQVKSNYLASARKALEAFRGGEPAAKVKERWAALGRALRLRAEGTDPGAGVEDMVAVRDGAPAGSALRVSLDEMLARVEKEEASGALDVALMDLDGGDAPAGLAALFQVVRDFPGLPSAAKAKARLDAASRDPAAKDAWSAAEREHRGFLALRAADRLQRAGKEKEAREAWAKVAKEFEGTEAATRAASRK